MAEKKVIAAELSVTTGNSNANIKEVNKNLTDVNKTMEKTGATAKNTGEEVKSSTGSFGKLKDQMSALPGPLGQAGEGVNKVGTAFKALLANPIVLMLTALVAVLALVYKAFTNTFEGGQKMEQVFAGIKAAGQALLDNLAKIGGAIVKIFNFDFSGAIDDMKGVVKSAGEAYNVMAKLTEQAQGLHKEQLANDLDQAERAKRLAILREQATDESIPIAKRKALLKQLQVDAEQNAKDDIDLAKRTTDNKIAQLTIQKDGAKKNQDEITELKIKQINVETDNANELRRIGKQITSAEKQEQAEQKQIAAEKKAANKQAVADAKQKAAELKQISEKQIEDARKQVKEDLDNAKAQIKDQEDKNAKDVFEASKKVSIHAATNAALIKATKITEEEMLNIKRSAAEEEKAIDELKVSNYQRTVNLIGDSLNALAGLINKNTAASKVASIAATIINTYEAAWSIFKNASKNPATIPFPAYPYIQAGIAIAAGLKTVANIVKTPTPGGGGGASVPSGGGVAVPSAPIAPTQQSTRLDANSLNGIGSAVQPVQAYMVESSGANSQERLSRLNRAARLGG